MVESFQHKLDRVRSPRVQITYDVETGGALTMKELPFVVGILADLSGVPNTAKTKIKERKFVEIDRDNFEHIMQAIEPHVEFNIPTEKENETLPVALSFSDMADFEPLSVVKQMPSLGALYNTRGHLKDLLSKLDGNDTLDAMLMELIINPTKRVALEEELMSATPASSS